jgi:hypothetical protein
MSQPHNPARAARRKVEALEQLETEQACCQYCGNTDPLVVRRRRIVNHHIFGRKRDTLTVSACLNCHAVAHDGLEDAEVPMTQEKDSKVFARAIFRALAVHFSLLAKACWRFAKRMED